MGLLQGGDELLQLAGACLFGQYGQGGEGFLTGDGLEVARSGGVPHLAGLLVELVENIGQGAQVTGGIGGLHVQGGERVVRGLGGRREAAENGSHGGTAHAALDTGIPQLARHG